jgi:nitrogen fixation/metabolism regulation signal transduction histidine kinase
MNRKGYPRLKHETRLTLFCLLGGLPAVIAALLLLWAGGFHWRTQGTVAGVILVVWAVCAFLLREHVVRPLHTLANLLAGLQEGDLSFRARIGRPDDALGEVLQEANALAQTLQEQRTSALDATSLLRTVMAEIAVAVFAFDGERRLRLVNRAGEQLLAQPAGRLIGRDAAELGLAECLEGESMRTLQRVFPGGAGRWGIRVSTFYQQGRPHRLLIVGDLTRALREEELEAWKRLVRVLGHEFNNSLAPIKSIAGSLQHMLRQESPPADWKDDAAQGLSVIAGRAEALSRFLAAYATLAKLPPPQRKPIELGATLSRIAALETRLSVKVAPGGDVTIQGDADQLDQLLINLVRNGVDAALPVGGEVEVGWMRAHSHVEVWVRDGGPGLANTANLFVPFFTTKPGGSGIGLVLSRQIAEAHGGVLTLENRDPGPGCEARLRLPL